MDIYKIPIEFAVVVFPLIAFILTIPFLISQYNKYGAIPSLRSFLFYSLILYLITAYFMVILPLPEIKVVEKMTSPMLQLIPFNFITDIIESNFNITNFSSLIGIFQKPVVYTVVFNLFLAFPFGVYLRYYFNKKWYQTLIYSFLLSLFFELTQLSGLYGIYPRAYRLFDIDDLIINTIGGLLGHLFTPFFLIFLPTRQELDEKSYQKGKKVTLIRRIMAFCIDLFAVSIINLVINILTYNIELNINSFLITITIYYLILPLITRGKTIGKAVVNLKIESITENLKWYQLLLRNFLLAFLTIYPMAWIDLIKENLNIKYSNKIIVVIISILIIHQGLNFLSYFLSLFKAEHLFLYEKITKTKNVSTIKLETKTEKNTQEEKLQKKEEPSTKKTTKSKIIISKKNIKDIKTQKNKANKHNNLTKKVKII